MTKSPSATMRKSHAQANSAPTASAEPLSAATKMVPLAFIFRKVAWKLSSCKSVLSRVIPASVLTIGTLLMSLAIRETIPAMRVLIGGNPTPPCWSHVTSEWLKNRSGCVPVKTTAWMFGSRSARSTSSFSCLVSAASNSACGRKIEHDMPVRAVFAGPVDDEVGVQHAGSRIGRRGIDDPRADLDRVEVRGLDRAERAGGARVLRALLRHMERSAPRRGTGVLGGARDGERSGRDGGQEQYEDRLELEARSVWLQLGHVFLLGLSIAVRDFKATASTIRSCCRPTSARCIRSCSVAARSSLRRPRAMCQSTVFRLRPSSAPIARRLRPWATSSTICCSTADSSGTAMSETSSSVDTARVRLAADAPLTRP